MHLLCKRLLKTCQLQRCVSACAACCNIHFCLFRSSSSSSGSSSSSMISSASFVQAPAYRLVVRLKTQDARVACFATAPTSSGGSSVPPHLLFSDRYRVESGGQASYAVFGVNLRGLETLHARTSVSSSNPSRAAVSAAEKLPRVRLQTHLGTIRDLSFNQDSSLASRISSLTACFDLPVWLVCRAATWFSLEIMLMHAHEGVVNGRR